MKLAVLAPVSALFVLVSLCGSAVPAPPATVSGSVYLDANRNGIHDSCDSPLSKAQVVATSADGTRTLARTDSNGSFQIAKVPSGDTVVSLDTPDNFVWPLTVKTPDSHDGVAITVKGPNDVTGVEFGAELRVGVPANVYSIQGIVYNDKNANGQVDADECVIREASVYTNDAGLQSSIQGDVSEPGGTFAFNLSVPQQGKLFVNSIASSWSPTTGDPCSQGITPELWLGDHVYRANIGFTKRPATGYLTGYVFDDQNQNGVRDGGEPGVSGLSLSAVPAGPTCALYQPSIISTDQAGAYRFPPMPRGSYYIDLKDNTYTGGDAKRLLTDRQPQAAYAVANVQVSIDIAATVVAPAYANVVLFRDDNGNSVQDQGEPGYQQAQQVCLYDNQKINAPPPYREPHLVPTGQNPCSLTDPYGSAHIGPLLPGLYHMTILDFAAYYYSLPTAGPDVTLSGDSELNVEVPYNGPPPTPVPTPRPTPDPGPLVFGDGGITEDMQVCHSEPDWPSHGPAVLNVQGGGAGVWASNQGLPSAVLTGCELPSPTVSITGPIEGARLRYDLAGLEPIAARGKGSVTEVIVRRRDSGIYGITLPGPGPTFGQNTIVFVDESYRVIAYCNLGYDCTAPVP